MQRLTYYLIFALLAANGERAIAATGYAYGANHCYHFEAPRGWAMDNSVATGEGVPMVFYPFGTSWKSAPVAMYTRPISSAKGRPDSVRIREQVDEVVGMYRAASESVEATKVKTVQSNSGAKGELWSFTGYESGGAELVAYFAARKTVNFFVMQISSSSEVKEQIPVLLQLAASYREAAECKPCSNSSACTIPN
jgi:hypothetical protein